MKKPLEKSLKKLSLKEDKILNSSKKDFPLKAEIYSKIPPTVVNTLEAAFIKAFQTVFLKGTGVIEKTFDKDELTVGFKSSDYILSKRNNNKSIKRLDAPSKKSNFFNKTVTTAAGFGLGALGMGLPDIPLLVGIILKGIYEIAISYGINYESPEEKIYILRLIRLALCASEQRPAALVALEQENYINSDLNSEIVLTSKVMSKALLLEKFIQGLPIVGLYGGIVNYATYKKISTLAVIKYKQRYLKSKLPTV